MEIEDSSTRQSLLGKILSSHFMEYRNGRLVMPDVSIEDLGPAVFTFTQGILKVSDMALWKRERAKNMFMENFKKAIPEAVGTRDFIFDYSDPQIDPEANYPVNCLVTGKKGLHIHIYAAHTDGKAKDSMVSMYYYERHGNKALSCAIFDAASDMGIKTRSKVTDIADKTISSLSALSEALPRFIEKYESIA